MLFYAVLLAALPLALALTCPCPPAPAGSEVCGSDLVTYDSQCHLLKCAAEPEPGLSLNHTGPCSATEEGERWKGCIAMRKCRTADCGCDEDDYRCKKMCRLNCRCDCAGYPRGGMDYDLWSECRYRCHGMYYNQCPQRCLEEGCDDVKQCLDFIKCECMCALQAYPARQRKGNWTACLQRHQCHNRTCSECTGANPDKLCAKRCERRCQCECAGWTRRDLSGEWEECFTGTQTCEQAHSACVIECGDQDDCKDKCYMARVDCKCECRTAKEEELRLWDECTDDKVWGECNEKRCDCHEADADCADRCKRNCMCGCLGIKADRLDAASLLQCHIDNMCQTTWENCLKDCDKPSDKLSDKPSDEDKREECQLSCKLALEKCYCECARNRPPERVEIIQHCNFIC